MENIVKVAFRCGHTDELDLDALAEWENENLTARQLIERTSHKLCWDCLNGKIDKQTQMLENSHLMPSDRGY